jgi:hypothetical protein
MLIVTRSPSFQYDVKARRTLPLVAAGGVTVWPAVVAPAALLPSGVALPSALRVAASRSESVSEVDFDAVSVTLVSSAAPCPLSMRTVYFPGRIVRTPSSPARTHNTTEIEVNIQSVPCVSVHICMPCTCLRLLDQRAWVARKSGWPSCWRGGAVGCCATVEYEREGEEPRAEREGEPRAEREGEPRAEREGGPRAEREGEPRAESAFYVLKKSKALTS